MTKRFSKTRLMARPDRAARVTVPAASPGGGARPPARFTGGIGERWGLKVTAPWGHLSIDEDAIRIWGTGPAKGADLSLARPEVAAVRISSGVLCVRIGLVDRDGEEHEPFFVVTRREAVRRELSLRSWPVIEDRWKLGRRRGSPSRREPVA